MDPQALRAAAKALAAMDLAKGDTESAKARYRTLLAKVPEDSYALTSLAQLAAGEGRMREAIKLLVRARTSDPDALGPILVLSAYYTQVGDTRKALDTAEDAFALAPHDSRVLLILATAQTAGWVDEQMYNYVFWFLTTWTGMSMKHAWDKKEA